MWRIRRATLVESEAAGVVVKNWCLVAYFRSEKKILAAASIGGVVGGSAFIKEP